MLQSDPVTFWSAPGNKKNIQSSGMRSAFCYGSSDPGDQLKMESGTKPTKHILVHMASLAAPKVAGYISIATGKEMDSERAIDGTKTMMAALSD